MADRRKKKNQNALICLFLYDTVSQKTNYIYIYKCARGSFCLSLILLATHLHAAIIKDSMQHSQLLLRHQRLIGGGPHSGAADRVLHHQRAHNWIGPQGY
jgi:hypothetical protein